MNLTRLFNISILLLLFSLTSCLKDDDSNVKINIEEEFDVQFFEQLLPNQNKLFIHVLTKEDLPCSNVKLGHSTSSNSDGFVVSIDGVELDGECDNIESTAETSAPFGSVTTGSYTLEINLALNSITNQGTMIVTEEGYKMEMETSYGITLLENNLRSIPDGYFWGYVELLDSGAGGLRDSFLTSLESYSKMIHFSEGYYGHFDYRGGKAILNPMTIEETISSDAVTFIHELNTDKSELVSFIQDFQLAKEGVLKVVLFMGDGTVL